MKEQYQNSRSKGKRQELIKYCSNSTPPRIYFGRTLLIILEYLLRPDPDSASEISETFKSS